MGKVTSASAAGAGANGRPPVDFEVRAPAETDQIRGVHRRGVQPHTAARQGLHGSQRRLHEPHPGLKSEAGISRGHSFAAYCVGVFV